MNPWAILGIILALSAVGSGIYVAGKRATRAEYAERDNAAIRVANEARDAALLKIKGLEDKAVSDMAAIVEKTDKEKSDGKIELQGALADVASGKLRLRNLARGCAPTDPRPPAQAGATTPTPAEADADRRAKEDASFLARFAEERDAIAKDKNLCVAIAVRDRERQ